MRSPNLASRPRHRNGARRARSATRRRTRDGSYTQAGGATGRYRRYRHRGQSAGTRDGTRCPSRSTAERCWGDLPHHAGLLSPVSRYHPQHRRFRPIAAAVRRRGDTPMTKQHAALTYSSYLALDEVLNAQRPRSDEHDEMLFIVIHQVYELWFKQLLHEMDHLQARLEAGDTSHVIRTLRRILTILKVNVAQIDVLETMTPSQFTSFRDRLEASSGFQSGQFRELEAVLGRRDTAVFRHYPEGTAARENIAAR